MNAAKRHFASKGTISVAIASIALVLIGCAPENPDDLRATPGASSTFHVQIPYDVVYANEQQGFLHCMTGAYYEMTFAIHPTIDVANKSASIVLVHHGAWKDIWAVVDIQGSADGSTVHAYSTGHPLTKDFPDVAEQWASGKPVCQQYAITTKQFPLSE
jgi:hypothetical protein